MTDVRGPLYIGIVLQCDVCREASVQHRAPELMEEPELRAAVDAMAHALGWTIKNEVATCPGCQKKRSELS